MVSGSIRSLPWMRRCDPTPGGSAAAQQLRAAWASGARRARPEPGGPARRRSASRLAAPGRRDRRVGARRSVSSSQPCKTMASRLTKTNCRTNVGTPAGSCAGRSRSRTTSNPPAKQGPRGTRPPGPGPQWPPRDQLVSVEQQMPAVEDWDGQEIDAGRRSTEMQRRQLDERRADRHSRVDLRDPRRLGDGLPASPSPEAWAMPMTLPSWSASPAPRDHPAQVEDGGAATIPGLARRRAPTRLQRAVADDGAAARRAGPGSRPSARPPNGLRLGRPGPARRSGASARAGRAATVKRIGSPGRGSATKRCTSSKRRGRSAVRPAVTRSPGRNPARAAALAGLAPRRPGAWPPVRRTRRRRSANSTMDSTKLAAGPASDDQRALPQAA